MAGMPTDANANAETVAIASARDRVNALRSCLEASEGSAVRLIETHISWVLLTAAFAYKLKKPVQLSFLDFSTLAARRHFCVEELRLNRRLAASVYLDVVDVCDSPQGPRFGGAGQVLDVAVRMRRFPDGALWSEMLSEGRLAANHIDAMALRLADFHRDAAVAAPDSGFGSAQVQRRVTQGIIDAIDAVRSIQRSQRTAAAHGLAIDWPALRDWLAQQQRALAPRWAARLRAGRVRECHGDLHLSNVLQLDGVASAFDGIEFDAELRWIDVLDDIAFLAMDLIAHGQRPLAARFINAYLDASGDHDGLPALRFFMVRRALVRAQVMALREPARHDNPAAGRSGTADYLATASALAAHNNARLAITHGLPGSGKSFTSQRLIEAVGAIRVRSDVERKRLFGLSALQSSQGRVPGGIYTDDATRRTVARLHELARTALGAGWPVLVDAAFLRRAERRKFAALAASFALPFSIIDCKASLPLLRQRVEQRALRQASGVADASEADVAVLERLIDADEPLDEAERALAIVVDADAAPPVAPATLAAHWLAAIPP